MTASLAQSIETGRPGAALVVRAADPQDEQHVQARWCAGYRPEAGICA